jgi:lactate racemase-like protein
VRESIVFGDRFIDVELPDTTRTAEAGLTLPLEPVTDLGETVRGALSAPLDTAPLRDLVKRGYKVTLAFDDPTVPCFAPVWPVAMPITLEELEAGGVRREDVTLLCANALHRKFRHEELAKLIGDDLVGEFGDRLRCHDAEDPDNLVHLGTTESGYDVELNRAVVDSDLTIYLNASTTRGFSGGWKSVCVGLSTWRSIRWHHTPDTMSMSLERNRMHEMLDEMGALVERSLGRERIFKIETALTNPIQVAHMWGGSVGATRAAALEVLKRHHTARRDLIDERADVVLYGVPDWSPYAAFSYLNPLLTLISTGLGYLGGVIEAMGKPGCTAILATPCPDRWDEVAHPSYRETWDRVLPLTTDPYEIIARFGDEFAGRDDYVDRYRSGYGFHPVHSLMATFPLKRLRHAGRVIVAGIENPALAEHLGFGAAASVEDALSMHGPEPTVALVRYPMGVNRQ